MSRERKYKNEGDVKKHVKEILNTYKHLYWDMPGATQFGRVGRHDFLVVQRGLFWTIETKFGGNIPNDNQINYANGVAGAGGISLMVHEGNIFEVQYVADYIANNDILPAGHNFEIFRK